MEFDEAKKRIEELENQNSQLRSILTSHYVSLPFVSDPDYLRVSAFDVNKMTAQEVVNRITYFIDASLSYHKEKLEEAYKDRQPFGVQLHNNGVQTFLNIKCMLMSRFGSSIKINGRCLTDVEPDTTGVQQVNAESGAG